MYTRVKPLLSIARQEDEMRQAAEELEKTKEEMEKLTDIKKQLEERNAMMERELQDLKANSGSIEETLSEAQEQVDELMKAKFDMEALIKVRKFPNYIQLNMFNILTATFLTVPDRQNSLLAKMFHEMRKYTSSCNRNTKSVLKNKKQMQKTQMKRRANCMTRLATLRRMLKAWKIN